MSHTKTQYVEFWRLTHGGKSALTVIKLMMACNDMQLANEALAEWKKEQSCMRKGRQNGAQMYFLRLQISHLYEAGKIIKDIKKDPRLKQLLETCDDRTQESLREFESYLPGGHKCGRISEIFQKIRNNLTFHYNKDGKYIEKAIRYRASRPKGRPSTVTRGNAMLLWHFKVGDDIIDSILVHDILGVPHDADTRTEIDKILDEMHQVFLSFMDFAGEYIWKYCKRG